jgi:hypothetical protein
MSAYRRPRMHALRIRLGAGMLAAAALVAAAVLDTPAAGADPDYKFFQSPSGNISCQLGTFVDNGVPRATAACEISEHTFTTPPKPAACEGGWGDRVGVTQGAHASLQCHTDTMRGSKDPVLDYGQTLSAGPLTCRSDQSGITCSDSTTQHGFSLSRDSYTVS